MRFFLFSFFFFFLFFSNTIEHFQIKGHGFTQLSEAYRLYDSKGTSMVLYHDEKNGDLRYLLTFVLHDKTGGCAYKSMEDGHLEREGDQLIFFTRWTRSGSAVDAPVGARIMRYTVEDNGTLKLLESKIYIEAHKRKKEDRSGMRYLFNMPQTSEEKEALESYVAQMQESFDGQFVFGEEAKRLKEQVAVALVPKKKSVWEKQ